MRKLLLVCLVPVLLFCSACGISQSDYDAAVSAAYDEGYSDGYNDGEDDGYDNGFSAGKSKGMSDGYSDGYEDGYAEALGVQDPVYITFSGSKYHRSWCSYLSQSAIMTSRSNAIARGYTPCSRCNP